MGAVYFYQLSHGSVEDTLRTLIGRSLDQGWRVMLRSPDRAALERLDERLWLEPEDGFLPHGMEGGPQDAAQPVLLGQGPVANAAQAVLLFGGARVDLAEAAITERTCLLFEEDDQALVQAARAEWKSVAAAGLVAAYWSDVSGRWEKKAESGAPAAVGTAGPQG